GDLPVGGALGDVDVVTGPVGQAPELRLELSVSLVDEVQFVPVDVACVEGGRLGAATQRDPAVVVAEQQQRFTGRVVLVGRAQPRGLDVHPLQRTLGPEGGGVVASVHVRGTAGEAVAAEFVVFEAVEVPMDLPRGRTLAQLDEGFHDISLLLRSEMVQECFGGRGSPRPRWAMTLSWSASVPAGGWRAGGPRERSAH